MAVLNGIEGRAHVEINNKDEWSGYILVEPNPINMNRFEIHGRPRPTYVYEGCVLSSGKFFFANGYVHVINVAYNSKEIRVDFVGASEINRTIAFEDKPKDYLD